MASTSSSRASFDEDDTQLAALGYVPSFKREFSNLATISFAFAIMGLCSSVATTFNTPLLLGGPSSVVWCWIIGSSMCFTLGASIAEIVSAYPTSGGLYTASAELCPRKHRAIVGWIVGWLNILGQVAGVSSTEFGLSNMIWAAVAIARPGFEVTSGKVVGLFAGLLIVHGLLNSLTTKHLAWFTKGFVFINLGTTALIIIVLLAVTPRSEMHPANYVFGSAGIVNQTGGWNTGLAFLFGVQWTMTDYDATAHISEEIHRAAYAAPVIGTGLFGWLLNIVMILCSGPLENLPGPSGSAFLQIMQNRMGTAGALVLWTPALHANSRTVFAFSRDHGLPDRGLFGRINKTTKTPLYSVWIVVLATFLPGLLDLASPVAANAIFSLTAMALDSSYIIPIILRRIYEHHPDVQFKPGPFYMGDGLLGWVTNIICCSWVCFVCVIFSFPNIIPVTKENMNYASVITVGVVAFSLVWYFLGGRRHYKGPVSNLPTDKNGDDRRDSVIEASTDVDESDQNADTKFV
ncbi:APC amino acid permease [Hysterangium stoloniferum]|nr:APC amino acid permease [Hysterangium stoloniferum]